MPIDNRVLHTLAMPQIRLVSRASAQETQREISDGQSDRCVISLNHSRGNANEKLIYCASAPIRGTGITIPDKPTAKTRCSTGEIPACLPNKG